MRTNAGVAIWGSLFTICVALLLIDQRDDPEFIFPISFAAPEHRAPDTNPKFEAAFVGSHAETPSVHAGTLTYLKNGSLLAAWFGGTREGAKDVSIYFARRESDSQQWSAPVVVASREQTTQELNRFIAKLGNPILFADSRGRVWLFYVTVSFGGWSGSSITFRYSDDDGESWSGAERLVTSPFLNVSTLVKGCPLECKSGHILLPVYHEFLRKCGELLTISPDGKLVSKTRLSATHRAIQPCVVPLNEKAVRVFYRQNGFADRMVLTQQIPNVFAPDSTALVATNIANPNAAVSVIRRNNKGFLMVCNPLDSGRHKLSLATSNDGLSWQVIHEIENSASPSEFSYPYLIQGRPGEYHLIYTWNRTKMRYAFFNERWLENAP